MKIRRLFGPASTLPGQGTYLPYGTSSGFRPPFSTSFVISGLFAGRFPRFGLKAQFCGNPGGRLNHGGDKPFLLRSADFSLGPGDADRGDGRSLVIPDGGADALHLFFDFPAIQGIALLADGRKLLDQLLLTGDGVRS